MENELLLVNYLYRKRRRHWVQELCTINAPQKTNLTESVQRSAIIKNTPSHTSHHSLWLI
jgi:hypothetical protein